MVSRSTLRRLFLGRAVAVAFALLVALYLLRVVRFQPTQIPAYLLIVAYDVVEVAIPALTPYHDVGFPIFLYLLAVVGAGAARWVRSGEDVESAVMQAAGGVCLLVGTMSLIFAGLVGGPLVASTDNPTPLAITLTAGIVLVVGGWLFLDRPLFDRLGLDAHDG